MPVSTGATAASSASHTVALSGMLGAAALALSYLEGLLPPLPGMPPGARLGLSNLAVMVGFRAVGFWPTLGIMLLKAAFAGLTRGLTAFWMSLAGGLLSGLAMYLLLRWQRSPFGSMGIGVVGAVLHNGGQMGVAMLLTATPSLLYYGPVLLLVALLTGSLTGYCYQLFGPLLQRTVPTQ